MKRAILYFEKMLIGKLQKIHLIGLNLPEEDEAILLWSLSSLYINFFYPETNYFDTLMLFDQLPEKRRKRIMKSYHRYVQRHNYVFNKTQNKHFLSKNSLFMPKLASLHAVYKDAKIVTINRNPGKTLPSSISLVNTLYGLFTSSKSNKKLDSKNFGNTYWLV